MEPQDLVQRAYPSLVDEFIARTTKPAKRKRVRKQAETSLNDLSGLLEALPKISKKSNKEKAKKPPAAPITKYFPVVTELAIDVPSDFSDCSLNETYGDVINAIVSRKPDIEEIENGRKLFYESQPATSTPTTTNKYLLDDTLLRRVKRKSYKDQFGSFDEQLQPIEMSFFFEKVNDSQDFFEASFNECLMQV